MDGVSQQGNGVVGKRFEGVLTPFAYQSQHRSVLAFTEPMLRGLCRSPGLPASAPARAPTSMGSPKGVPVPCTATYVTACGDMPAEDRHEAMRVCWLGPFGAVKEEDFPS